MFCLPRETNRGNPHMISQNSQKYQYYSLRKKCPNTEFFLLRIQSKYRKLGTRKNFVLGHFSRSDSVGVHYLTIKIRNAYRSLPYISDHKFFSRLLLHCLFYFYTLSFLLPSKHCIDQNLSACYAFRTLEEKPAQEFLNWCLKNVD